MLFHFKAMAYYGSEFEVRKSSWEIMEVAKSLRVDAVKPPTFKVLKDFWE